MARAGWLRPSLVQTRCVSPFLGSPSCVRTSQASCPALTLPASFPPQNASPKGPPFLPGASLVKLGSRELWMVFRAPYCTDLTAMIPGMSPAKSPQHHAERSGYYLSFFYPDLRFTGLGCWRGELPLRPAAPSTLCIWALSSRRLDPCPPVVNAALAGKPATSFSTCYSPDHIQVLQLEGGHKDAEHWGPYGHRPMGPRNLPPQLKQMQPTGLDEQGDEGRRRALEAATVARAEGGDWSSIAQYLRESPAAGPMRREECEFFEEVTADGMTYSNFRKWVATQRAPEPLDGEMANQLAAWVFIVEIRPRLTRAYPALTVSRD